MVTFLWSPPLLQVRESLLQRGQAALAQLELVPRSGVGAEGRQGGGLDLDLLLQPLARLILGQQVLVGPVVARNLLVGAHSQLAAWSRAGGAPTGFP